MPYQELFSDSSHKALLERGEALWRVVRHHPRYAYYGTVVSLSDPGEDTACVVASLARIQGLGMCFYLPETAATPIRRQLDGEGFRTGQSLFCRVGQAAYDASKSLLHSGAPPESVTIEPLTDRSSDTLVEATVALCQACGLSAMPGEIMRGSVLPGINLVAKDAAGAPVATAASYAMHAPGTRRAKEAFWGVLATRDDHRARGLAGWLGALAIQHMWEHAGMRVFNTGVKEDNAASLAACAKLGIRRSDLVTLFCYDDATLAEGPQNGRVLNPVKRTTRL
ncbi:MAG: GNAT family N-acetyltransferase [Pseudomonadota bacterium]